MHEGGTKAPEDLSILKHTKLPLSWFATTSQSPLGCSAKFRGVTPPVETWETSDGMPFSSSTRKIAMVPSASLSRLEP